MLWNMKLTGLKTLESGLGELYIGGPIGTIQTTGLLRSTRILGGVIET